MEPANKVRKGFINQYPKTKNIKPSPSYWDDVNVLSLLAVMLGIFFSPYAASQTKDTLINVGNHNLHFSVTPGIGMPIVFESGAGNDGSVWSEVCKRLRQYIDAPIVTYDRAGFGRSEIDTNKINITNEVNDLREGLKQLKFEGNYFLVAHSLGGNYAMKFIADAPDKVKGAIFIDIVSPYFMTALRATQTKQLFMDSLASIKKESIGFYHLVLNYENTSAVMREVTKSIHTPITVIASGKTPFEGNDRQLFSEGLRRFALEKENRKYVLAEDAEHYVFYDEPDLVVCEIVALYNQVKP